MNVRLSGYQYWWRWVLHGFGWLRQRLLRHCGLFLRYNSPRGITPSLEFYIHPDGLVDDNGYIASDYDASDSYGSFSPKTSNNGTVYYIGDIGEVFGGNTYEVIDYSYGNYTLRILIIFMNMI